MGFVRRFFLSIIFAIIATLLFLYFFGSGGIDTTQLSSYAIIVLIVAVIFFIIGSIFFRKKTPSLANAGDIQRNFNDEARQLKVAFEKGQISAQQYQETMKRIEYRYEQLKKAA